MSGSLRPINLGVPDITVVVRENSDANKVLVDVPNISVNIETSPDYKVSVQPSSLVVQRTGSLPSLAVSALFANTASYALAVSGSIDSAISASFATTASYALNAITTLPAGVVSSSGQINTGSFTGSFTGVLIGTSSWASNAVSSSFAVTASYVSGAASTWDTITDKPSGLVSSSLQINTGSFSGSFTGRLIGTASWATSASYVLPSGLPIGTVSSSTQVSYTGLSNIPVNIVSSSTQIVAFGFATTGSNSFNGNQTITGSLIQGLEGNIATGENSHAEGSITKAIGNYSHAEGDNTQAIGDYSHAEGQETIASGSYSHAEGYQTIALANHQHVQGQYNAVSSVPSAFIVGNGTDDSNRSNLIYAAGNEVQITGSLKVTNGITGSLYGTASRALTASYAANAVSVPAGTVSSSAQVVTYVSGSTIVPNRVESNEYKLIAGAVSLIFTGSITSGIFGATEYVLPFIPTSSFCAATVEYVASRAGGLRVGVILAGWSGSNTTVTDISSTDIGDTSDIRFSLIQDSGYIKFRVESLGSGSYPWTVQSLFKLFPNLL